MNTRRSVLGHLGAAVLALPALPARAESGYPSRPVRIVVPVAAGGGTDFAARALAEKLHPALGQPVIVENRPGASGNVGVQMVASAEPDGYTLVMPITSFPINPSLHKLPFDSVRDFAPVILVATLPLVLVVNPALKVGSLQELLALAKRADKPLHFANSGVGTTAHLAGELFNRMAGTRMISVNYKGGGPAVADLLGGHVEVYFSTIPSVSQHIQSGRLRALAVTGKARSGELPDVPTVIEAGLPGFEVTAWFGLFAPAGTPTPAIARLNGEIGRILSTPELRQAYAKHGLEPGGGSSADLGRFLVAEIDRWAKVIREAGIRAES